MLVDDVTIRLIAGKGGDGAVAFQKVRLNQGPTGADGGRGANIYFEGVPDINALQFYASKKEIKAQDGENGKSQFRDGRDGDDLILKIPVGTVVTNLSTGFLKEITHPGERILAAGGGMGGRGNFKYRSSTNTSPKQADRGSMGDIVDYRLELQLIADVGLIGLPNAGKSSLLNELTSAKSKVANYAFTTLEPNLGSYYGLIIADIPGLIEGASEGKGLGDKFLRHIERTRVLFHLISAESDHIVRDYNVIRTELNNYDPALMEKPEYVFLTKTDMVEPADAKEKLALLKKAGADAKAVSLLDPDSANAVRTILNQIKDGGGA